MALQIADVVADAADAELAEVGEVLADLRGVQMELLGQRLRRDRPHAGIVERVQAAQVHRQAVGGELGDLLGALFDRQVLAGPLFNAFTSTDDCTKSDLASPCADSDPGPAFG